MISVLSERFGDILRLVLLTSDQSLFYVVWKLIVLAFLLLKMVNMMQSIWSKEVQMNNVENVKQIKL